MRRVGFWWMLAVAACSSTAPSPRPPPAPAARPEPAVDDARAVIDFAGVDAWLECARAAADLRGCERASAVTAGGRIATLSMATFGDGEAPAVTPDRVAVEALVTRMKAWPDGLSRAARFLPARVGGGALRVFVVANGHGWGDAYVRRVEGRGESARLSESGEPTIMLNAVLIASGFRGDVDEKAASAFGVLSHELFHALFHRYRAQSRNWAPLAEELAPRQALQLLVLDEGVAHFVHREERLAREGFERDRADAAFAALGSAWGELARAQGREAEEILRSANQGSYWDKYGSISGMLLSYGVARRFGDEGIQEAVRCGPGRLLSLYMRAAAGQSDLPPLPESLPPGAWIDLCRGAR